MVEMKGYAGKFLRVNLTTGTVKDEPLPLPVAMDFVAGQGFGIKYLYDELKPGIEALGEQNKLLLVPGVLAGTRAQEWPAGTPAPKVRRPGVLPSLAAAATSGPGSNLRVMILLF
jgi:hypothetical protein